MRVGPATPPPAPDDAALRAAARDMEAVLLRQMLRSSGVYGGGEGPGASVREDMFVNALADAVVQAGGLGLAETLTRAMGPAAARPASVPVPAPVPAPGFGPGIAALPTEGRLSSPFGVRTDPFTGAPRAHRGVDVGAPEGSAIRATADGIVRAAGPRGGYGNAVEVDHGNGLTTLYAHASELLVAPGELVRAGQEIARVGSTGRSTGPHLHFEVRVGGKAVDPARVLKVYAARVEADPRSGP
ncbi:MAG TPA: peptidoglycan DD-metalloendopeptidase family protein [Anaeromyxobacter sp.]|nr:peptidoglycan DD-metalloendopeptidase family protein [Anaeromyxobacter sp.]